jgi:hypothetical protein
MACSTFCRVFELTFELPLTTRETVMMDTPALRATSACESIRHFGPEWAALQGFPGGAVAAHDWNPIDFHSKVLYDG